jgi:hypothetical protein
MSSSPHQSKAFKYLWISENKQTEAIEKTEGPLRKDMGKFFAARNGEHHQFQSNKKELEAALMVRLMAYLLTKMKEIYFYSRQEVTHFYLL